MPRPLRVLVVGPKHTAANSRGGMASVVTIMRERRDPRVRVRTVATYVDDRTRVRMAVGVRGMALSTLLVLLRRADVVHVHLSHKGSVARKVPALLAARLVHVPAVVHAHSYNFAAWFNGLPGWGQRVVRWALAAQRWIVLGDALAQEYAHLLQVRPEQVLVLRNPANLPGYLAPHQPSPDRVKLVFLGRHGERKGSYDLVRALGLLDPDVRARIGVVAAGDGDVAAVQAAARKAGLEDVLEVRGWIGPRDRDAVLATGEIFVLPSYDEALPMAMLEAMAWGLAPIVTPVGGIPEVITDGVDGLMVAPGDVAGLAAALKSLVLDDALRHTIAAAAQHKATEFDTDRWFDALVREWQRLAAGG